MNHQNIERILNQNKRPPAITVICILGFIGSVYTIPLIFSAIASVIGSWYPPYLGLTGIIGFFCFIGFWKMKKWAAYTYAILVFINQIILFSMEIWNAFALIIPSIIIAVVFSQIKKME